MYAIQCNAEGVWEVSQTWGGDVKHSAVAAIYFNKKDALEDLADWQLANPMYEYRVVEVLQIIVRES